MVTCWPWPKGRCWSIPCRMTATIPFRNCAASCLAAAWRSNLARWAWCCASRQIGLPQQANWRCPQSPVPHVFRGKKQGVATPKTDAFIELEIHPRYKYNLGRYLQVVRSVALFESPQEQLERLELLERQLLDPVTSAQAALRLEAIGKDAVRILKKGLESNDAEVRFYSAESLAYLDQSCAVPVLAEAVKSEPAFRAYALTALCALNDVHAADALRDLFDVSSAETRYGAFRALWAMNERDPQLRGEHLSDKFWLYVVPSAGPPMVHVTHSYRPEIVLFGEESKIPAAVHA